MEEKNSHRRGKWFAIGAGLGAALERAYRKGDEMENPASERREKTAKAAMIVLLVAGFVILLFLYFLLRTKR
jgi:hypothetical protein